ncbi:ATP-grasp fold amidoligase family protein [Ruminococcus flavefaciens]|uniref:TupA-like ATPgrasp n=1 Tax=Ruminococcus flavefaciens TaxID=1265 RepID=A0A1M7J6D1_RUMFL|nr:ATP-grasp fold amidoligase family protein [Ruminococcus flavefaciens]SHM48007.1 TupA-like ATPgrasp [Ruminococcus flavefaciens]
MSLKSKIIKAMPDSLFLRLFYKHHMGKKLNLKDPKTFNEKLQWLKLHDRRPEYTTMVDKYAVKKYVADKIGEQYIIPTLGVWEKFDDIDFDKLPDRFVLKCTHDSGGLAICKDKSNFDMQAARAKIEKSLKTNYYHSLREWPYKNVPPRIIAEKYMTDDENSEGFTDYKFFCFDGKVDCVMVCLDRYTGDTKFYFFDKDWNLKRLNKRGKAAPEGFTIPKPECMDQMFELAAKLSEGITFVRVDLYQSCGQIYFGELTFYPDSGFDENILPEADEYWGRLLKLKKEN